MTDKTETPDLGLGLDLEKFSVPDSRQLKIMEKGSKQVEKSLNEDEDESEEFEEDYSEDDEQEDEYEEEVDESEEEDDESDEDESEKSEEEATEDAVAAEIEKLNKRLKDTRDFATQTKQESAKHQKMVIRSIKAMRDSGADDELIASALGLDNPEAVEDIVSGETAKVLMSDNPFQAKANAFQKKYEELKPFLESTMEGNPDDIVNVIDKAISLDPALRQEFMDAEDPMAFVFGKRGKEIAAKFSELSSGNLLSVIEDKNKQIAELESQLADLNNLDDSVKTKPKKRKLSNKPAKAATHVEDDLGLPSDRY